MNTIADVDWVPNGCCYRLGHDVPRPGGVVPNRIIIGRHFDPKDNNQSYPREIP